MARGSAKIRANVRFLPRGLNWITPQYKGVSKLQTSDAGIVGFRSDDLLCSPNIEKEHTRILQQHEYSFPSELLAAYGIRMLVSKAGELKAAEIPDLLTQGLHFEFTAEMLARYDRYRKIRNDIAHGKEPAHSLKEAFEVRKNLGKLASKIDDHIVANFFVMETFRS